MVCVFQLHSPIASWHMSFGVCCHYNKTHISWLPFMTALSHKIPKYDWRGTGGGWRARWLGLVITDESLRTSVIWIYTVVWAYKRTECTVPIAHGACLDWPWNPCPSLTCPGRKETNPTWNMTLCSHVFCWRVIWLARVNMLTTNLGIYYTNTNAWPRRMTTKGTHLLYT